MPKKKLKAALKAHKALMEGNTESTSTPETSIGGVYAMPFSPPPGASPPPPFMPPPPGFAMPPGFPPPPGMMPPPGLFAGSPPPGIPGAHPRAPMAPAPNFIPQQHSSASPPPVGIPPSPYPPGNFATPTPPSASLSATPAAATSGQGSSQPTLPKPELKQTNPPFKKPTELKYQDANFAPLTLQVPKKRPEGKKRARAEDFL
ncbi:hypothetical protein MPER_01602 [Moniliophthora perniciosa FA553]|nr:hypothetical protein MPER_01602 [Moniliophthora perniciosa FA553]